jgi:arginine decarboxylase
VRRVTPRTPVDIDLTDDALAAGRLPAAREAAAEVLPGLHITVRTGTGSGPTHLAAFDAALRQAGVAVRNLIPLSSIIPPAATVERTPTATTCPGDWGDRLYVVLADSRVERPHEEAWAGIAWRQDPETGEGLFVEHHGHSRHQVETDLLSTIEAITVGRTPRDWADPELAVVGVVCEEEPVCALAVACYDSEPWRVGDAIDLRDR